MNKFSIGEKVRCKETGQTGKVKRIIGCYEGYYYKVIVNRISTILAEDELESLEDKED